MSPAIFLLTCSGSTPSIFSRIPARRLQEHAQEIMSRVKAKQQDDLNIFEDYMEVVADGRFYQAVCGDPTRYSLKDDGLTLALGFAVTFVVAQVWRLVAGM